jgi:hypothetical protein
MMEQFSSKRPIDHMMPETLTYLLKAPMCGRMSPPAGTARNTTGMTSGLLVTATVLVALPILTPRIFKVCFQR